MRQEDVLKEQNELQDPGWFGTSTKKHQR